ncbi:MAG TPA: P22 phage major capsid protein family protein [Nocardioidaceae bacterium]|nr:P22 phage major capsid protein family protein [Nocardioidaceae bacterium]
MANAFIKAQKIVDAANLLLQREIVLPRLVTTDLSKQDFQYALNDTVTMRIPAVRTAKSRALRSQTGLVAEDLAETKVDVVLTDHIYDLLNITDEQLTLDIRDFARQVLNPQMRGVAEGLEEVIGAVFGTANAATTITYSGPKEAAPSDPFVDVILPARKALNDNNVPQGNRYLLVGSAVEVALLGDDRISKAQNSGDSLASNALQEATVARVGGFSVVTSNAIGENEAYAFHKTAVTFAAFAPALPDGATMKAATSADGFGMRYLRDYDPTNATGPVDRSLVDSFAGAASVEQGGVNKRLVKITFDNDGVA